MYGVSVQVVYEMSQGIVHVKAGAPAVRAFPNTGVRLPRLMRSKTNKKSVQMDIHSTIPETTRLLAFVLRHSLDSRGRLRGCKACMRPKTTIRHKSCRGGLVCST